MGNHDSSNGFSSSIASNGWANNIPSTVHNGGRMYQLRDAYTASEHGGTTDTTIYSTANGWDDNLKLVVGKDGSSVAENHFFKPKLSGWDQINDFSSAMSYNSGDIVRDGGSFWQANTNISPGSFNSSDWTDITSDVNDLEGALMGLMP